VDAVVAIVRVEVALEPGVRLTLVGARLAVRPVAAGEIAALNATEPVKPKLLAVIVEVVPLPAWTVAVVGLAASV